MVKTLKRGEVFEKTVFSSGSISTAFVHDCSSTELSEHETAAEIVPKKFLRVTKVKIIICRKRSFLT